MDSMASIVLTVLAILVLIIFIGSIYAFFFAIFLFVFSAGDPEKIKKAWNSIRYMIMGIIMTLLVLFFFPIILSRAKVPGHEMYNANNIFAQVSKISGGLLNLGKEAANNYQEGSVIWPLGTSVIPPENNEEATGEETAPDEVIPEDIDYDQLEL